MSVKGKGGFYVEKCEEVRSRWEITCAHTHSYTHTHTPPHIYTCIHTHIHAHPTHKHNHTHICTHPYTQTHPHSHINPDLHTYTRSHTYIPIHTDTPTLTYIHTLTHIHAVLHSHTHTMSLKSKSPKTQRVGDYFISPRLCVGTWSGEKLPAWAWLQEVMEHRGVRWVVHHWHLPCTTHRHKIWHHLTEEQNI